MGFLKDGNVHNQTFACRLKNTSLVTDFSANSFFSHCKLGGVLFGDWGRHGVREGRRRDRTPLWSFTEHGLDLPVLHEGLRLPGPPTWLDGVGCLGFGQQAEREHGDRHAHARTRTHTRTRTHGGSSRLVRGLRRSVNLSGAPCFPGFSGGGV